MHFPIFGCWKEQVQIHLRLIILGHLSKNLEGNSSLYANLVYSSSVSFLQACHDDVPSISSKPPTILTYILSHL